MQFPVTIHVATCSGKETQRAKLELDRP